MTTCGTGVNTDGSDDNDDLKNGITIGSRETTKFKVDNRKELGQFIKKKIGLARQNLD